MSLRLWVGAVLIILTVGVLLVDQHLAPWHPFLFVLIVGLSLTACREILGLLGPERPAQSWFCYLGLVLLGLANWLGHVGGSGHLLVEAWAWVLGTFTALILATFLVEMACFREPGQALERLARSVWIFAYLGLLPSFLAQLRWLTTAGKPAGTEALALAIFVPKVCDIGAYFTGRFLGRHRMTPVLSPKKTWEGAAGGLAAAIIAAVALDRLGPASLLRGQLILEISFGLTVGLAGMFGDLAESLIKRDCQKKDAAQRIPGFGGVLDVVDALLFAAPVAYLWLAALT